MNDERNWIIEWQIKLATKKILNVSLKVILIFNSILETREIINFNKEIIQAAQRERGLVRRWEVWNGIYHKESLDPVDSGIAIIKVLDGDIETVYQVLLANLTNEIEINQKCNSEHVYITFDQNLQNLQLRLNAVWLRIVWKRLSK